MPATLESIVRTHAFARVIGPFLLLAIGIWITYVGWFTKPPVPNS